MNFEKGLIDDVVVLLVLDQKNYNQKILKTVKSGSFGKIFYVALNKGCDYLTGLLAMGHVDLDNFFFLDCITKTLTNPVKVPQCVYLNSPEDLEGIKDTIIGSVGTYQTIFVDSISTFLVYYKPLEVIRFIRQLQDFISQYAGARLIFTVAKEGNDLFIKQLTKVIKKVVYV